jgi:hypothetical protein
MQLSLLTNEILPMIWETHLSQNLLVVTEIKAMGSYEKHGGQIKGNYHCDENLHILEDGTSDISLQEWTAIYS